MQTSNTPCRTRSSSSIWSLMPTPPRVLCIGPDRVGNLLEVIWIELVDERALAIHAMRLRPLFFGLLPESEGDT